MWLFCYFGIYFGSLRLSHQQNRLGLSLFRGASLIELPRFPKGVVNMGGSLNFDRGEGVGLESIHEGTIGGL